MPGPGVAREFVIPADDDEPAGDAVVLTVAGLEPAAYAALVDAHPPGRGDPPGLPWSEATFPPALIAASTGLAPEADAQLWDEGTPDVAEPLLELCLELSSPGSVDWALRRLAGDDRLALELDYCGPRGIAHSQFLTWPDRDRDLALAWLLARAGRCPGCGTPTADMGDPLAAEFEFRRCEVCSLKAEIEKGIPDAERGHIHLFIRPVPEHLRGAD